MGMAGAGTGAGQTNTVGPPWRPGSALKQFQPIHPPVCRVNALAGSAMALGALLMLTGCGGGGGGGGGDVITQPVVPSPPPPAPPAPPSPPPPGPSSTSTEYLRNYALGTIKASYAFDAGASGSGITVGVIDSGVDPTQADLIGAVSPDSTDIIASRGTPAGTDTHATFVAGVIASRFNGMGTIGVAYNSTILSVRADSAGTCAMTTSTGDSGCTFNSNNLAAGIDYAVAHGAKIINLSLGGDGQQGSAFEGALSRAVAAGVVFSIAAGNESLANPDYPAEYAIDRRYVGSIIAVGATQTDGKTLSTYSNMAGTAASEFVVAPGDDLITNCNSTSCFRGSGTSFATPVVSGALALLLQAFPNLTGKQAIALLIQTADDLGAPGVDPVYGNGIIDLQKAFAPVGTLSTPTSAGRLVSLQNQAGSNLAGAFGDAVSRTGALRTVGYDSYNRLFAIDLSSGYHTAQRAMLRGATDPAQHETSVALATAPGVSLDFSASQSPFGAPEPLHAVGFQSTQETPADIRLRVTAGRFSLVGWNGQGGASPSPDLVASHDGFASLARSDHAVQASYDFGGFSLGGEAGSGTRYTLYGLANLEPSHYALATASWARGPFVLALSGGELTEPQGPLGSFLPNTSSFTTPASTHFVSLAADWRAAPWLAISAEGSLGSTKAPGRMVGLDGAVTSSTWRVAARTLCAGAGNCLGFLAQVDQPLRIERGQFTATLADIPAAYDDPIQLSTRRFSASPSGRQVDFRFGVDQNWVGVGDLQVLAVTTLEEGNVASEPLSLGVVANWRSRF